MLLKTVKFNSKNPNWVNDQNHNHMFLFVQERYINDIIRLRGYIYLNQICELLGVKWNPNDENPCIKNDGVNRVRFIEFEIFNQPKNSVLVHILSYNTEKIES